MTKTAKEQFEDLMGYFPVDMDYHEALVTEMMASHISFYQMENPLDLISFFNDYTNFNGCFANGVAALSALIGNQRKLFLDPEQPIKSIADRSNLVASFVFDAARDEYNSYNPHRALAQNFVIGLVEYCAPGFEADFLPQTEQHEEYFKAVMDGYTGKLYPDDQPDFQAFYGMGYHIGSEILADSEFTMIDRDIQKWLPDLYTALIVGQPGKPSPYCWINIHSGLGDAVEQDHAEQAVRAAELAFKYVPEDKRVVYKQALLNGFLKFAEDHEKFFTLTK